MDTKKELQEVEAAIMEGLESVRTYPAKMDNLFKAHDAEGIIQELEGEEMSYIFKRLFWSDSAARILREQTRMPLAKALMEEIQRMGTYLERGYPADYNKPGAPLLKTKVEDARRHWYAWIPRYLQDQLDTLLKYQERNEAEGGPQ